MSASLTVSLLETWEPGARTPPHRRLSALLRAIYGPATVEDDTLGGRCCRLLLLRREWGGGKMEGVVTCERCAERSEFIVPVEEIMNAARPAPDARVQLHEQGRIFTFRLPRMSDIEAASGLTNFDDVRQAIMRRCALDSDHPPAALADRLGARFEALDPAANIVLKTVCSGCAAPIVAAVDIATFVARDLDRIVERLLRDIDAIASAYGWSEAAIADLPPRRRRRYVAMIAEARRQAPPPLTRRRS